MTTTEMTIYEKLDTILTCIENQKVCMCKWHPHGEGNTMADIVRILHMDLHLMEMAHIEDRLLSDGYIEYVGHENSRSFIITASGIDFQRKSGYLLLERREYRKQMVDRFRKMFKKPIVFITFGSIKGNIIYN